VTTGELIGFLSGKQEKLAIEMKKKGIVAELEAFDAGMINYAKYLE
jgi:uncharacterized protein (DUF849 family)